MVAFKHDILLENSVLYLVLLYQDVFPNRLNSVELLGGFQLRQEDFPERASSNHHQEVEIFKRNRWLVVLVSHELCRSQLLNLFHSWPSFVLFAAIQMLEVFCQIVEIYKGLREKTLVLSLITR